VVGETHEDVFWSLSKLAADKRNANRCLHRIDVVILREVDAQKTAEQWDYMTGLSALGNLVQCNCGKEVRQT